MSSFRDRELYFESVSLMPPYIFREVNDGRGLLIIISASEAIPACCLRVGGDQRRNVEAARNIGQQA